MKFTVDTNELAEALQFVSGVIERKFTYPILTNVLVEVDQNAKVRLRSTDHDMTLGVELEALEMSEPGSMTIPGKRSTDVVNAQGRSGSVTVIETTEAGVEVHIDRSDFLLSTMPAEDFPPETQVVEAIEIEIAVEDLLYLLRCASPCMAQNDVRRQLNGALLEVTSAHVRSVATDGMVMCVCTNTSIKGDTDSVVQAVIPRKAVLEIVRGFGGVDGMAKVAIGANALRMTSDKRSLTTNLIQTRFPAYMRVVPSASDVVLKCDRNMMLDGIAKTQPVSDEQCKIFFEVDKDLMKIKANTETGDRGMIEIPVDFGENSTNVIFRHDRLQRVLNTFSADEIAFHIPVPTESVRVDSEQQGELLFVVSPIRG